MVKGKEFNPIRAARKVEESYREYIATTIHFADPSLQAQLEEILHERGYLAKGPFLEAAPPYRKDKSPAELVEEGVLCGSMLKLGGGDPDKFDPARPLYVHQVRAVRKAAAGRNYAVVTGTGSGKTESFLLPILNDILHEFEQSRPSAGVRAMILYPMNALANDQLKRLRTLLEGTDITFGRYTGDTEETESKALPKWKEENPGQVKLPNEIISREEIRKNPPNILLTNYSMLEYLLLRPKDAPLFAGAFGSSWRHVAIDEAHVYTGTLGTEIAYLLRRLKARIESETGARPKLRCYATSATIGSEEDMPKVATFAQDLFGEPFVSEGDDIDVITSEKDHPQDALDDKPWGALPLSAWSELRSLLADKDDVSAEEVGRLLLDFGVPEEVVSRMSGMTPLQGLGKVLLGEDSSCKLVRRCSRLLDMTDPSAISEVGIEGLDSEGDCEVLSAMVEVLSSAQRSKDVPVLSSRYHSFLRAPEGIFLNAHTGKLTARKRVSEPYDDTFSTPVYEVSVCRHCGQAYALGTEEYDKEARVPWLNPRHEGTDADDEFLPRKYYRILSAKEDADHDEEIQWLCPICGSLHHEEEGGEHRFRHEEANRLPVALNEIEGKQADEETARCRHCGYQSRVAIQPMRVSPEAAGSVVCYDLVREIPPFDSEEKPEEDDWFAEPDEERRAGSVICFSDKRQDAAFFAPAMERTYGRITHRQLIREAVEVVGGSEGCSPTAVINWIAGSANRRYPGLLGADKKGQATAWLLDELSAEDSRNSLEGLGVVRIEPTAFNEGFSNAKVRGVVEKALGQIEGDSFSWLGVDDYIVFAKVCLELLRERNVIEVPEGVSVMRSNREKRGNLVILGGESASASGDVVQFAGAPTNATENKRSAFIRKYARRVHGVELSREESVSILQSLFKFLTQYLGGYFKGEGYLVGPKETVKDKFRLSKDIWTLYPHRPDDVIYRCDSCGCESHLFTNGVCTTSKCEGSMCKTSFAEAMGKDRYYKGVYQEEALPLDIQEHTAQLSSKKAREIQSAFIKGEVNILSCTTTFELGVDVGDLRAIFMRNVPPTTANYTQRAGRVGRRAGMPGYAITFARLRPHDLAHFENPEKIIGGSTRVPVCYLDNEAIAARHVFAIALSEFFRDVCKDGVRDYSQHYHDFMDLSTEDPKGLQELRSYLSSRPEKVFRQISRVVPEGLPSVQRLRSEDWVWADLLVGASKDNTGSDAGRLLQAHALKHADFARVQQGVADYMNEDDYKASSLLRSLAALKGEGTISVLAENGILPKYGFPTDLVELHLPAVEQSVEENRLSLSRGMRQAIREYAPGSEIVAGKTLWRSVGLRKPKGQELTVRRYGKCPECEAFVWPIENYSNIGECPVCKTEFQLKGKMLIPTYGFEGIKVEKGIGLRRPRARGYATVHFSQHWPNETNLEKVSFAGGSVFKRYASNGHLCALNSPRMGFHVCDRCHAAAVGGESISHWHWCENSGRDVHISRYDALGSSFVSDVLELAFELDTFNGLSMEAWEAVMWALFTAASQILEVPESEIGGTMYDNEMHGVSIMLYDDVPGGAGHARQLSDRIDELMARAYAVVDGSCGCGEDTCCYGCIANYYNQTRQAKLSRGAAKEILGSLLFGGIGDAFGSNSAVVSAGRGQGSSTHNTTSTEEVFIPLFTGLSYDAGGLRRACEDVRTGSPLAKSFLERFVEVAGDALEELPEPNVAFESPEGASYALLAWRSACVAIFDREEYDYLCELAGTESPFMAQWQLLVAEDTLPEDLLALLIE